MKSRSKASDKKYEDYVPHPRYGRAPRHTALNPDPYDPAVQLHWNATSFRELRIRGERLFGKEDSPLADMENMFPHEPARVAGTAIVADPSKQNEPTVAVTHYYDIKKTCRSCNRPFLFFAEEQKHWYETLSFPLHADCVRCPECRKQEHFLARQRAVYERLAQTANRDWKQNFKMALSAVELVEHGIFGSRAIQRIRQLLKTVPQSERESSNYMKLITRVTALSEATKAKNTSND